jgi:hypothetical protein
MGYYDNQQQQKSDNRQSQNNSILLPELKSITPAIHNIKQPSSNHPQMINRKKSVEKVPYQQVDVSPHANGG